jgi:hypothetical protein
MFSRPGTGRSQDCVPHDRRDRSAPVHQGCRLASDLFRAIARMMQRMCRSAAPTTPTPPGTCRLALVYHEHILLSPLSRTPRSLARHRNHPSTRSEVIGFPAQPSTSPALEAALADHLSMHGPMLLPDRLRTTLHTPGLPTTVTLYGKILTGQTQIMPTTWYIPLLV